jgi:two-component system alkaline phosphatase synthesis response regulator PhoP
MNEKILIVDDEKDIRELLAYNLSKESYKVETAGDGLLALQKIDSTYDLLILDVMMPNLDGFETCKKIRSASAAYNNIPIILLTAKENEINEIIGLEIGADDYILKPVSMSILIARIRANLRRHSKSSSNLINIKYGDLIINVDSQKVKCCNNFISLTKTEFSLLQCLAESPEKVFRRQELLNSIVGSDVVVIDRVIDVHIKKIRDKLGKCGKYIHTAHGVGYSLSKDE